MVGRELELPVYKIQIVLTAMLSWIKKPLVHLQKTVLRDRMSYRYRMRCQIGLAPMLAIFLAYLRAKQTMKLYICLEQRKRPWYGSYKDV
jgi:hypothetical protein